MNEDASSLILRFYLGAGTDHMGRNLEGIISRDDRWLEATHDYIQWLFPLYAASRFNPCAPMLTDEVRAVFLDKGHPDREALQENFAAAIRRMLAFYGYLIGPRTPGRVEPAPEWEIKGDRWLREGNHNHLRITRMLRCMTLLGRHELALSFHEALLEAARAQPDRVSRRTLGFWNEAVVPVPDEP